MVCEKKQVGSNSGMAEASSLHLQVRIEEDSKAIA